MAALGKIRAIVLLLAVWVHADAMAQNSPPLSVQLQSLHRALGGQSFIATAIVIPSTAAPGRIDITLAVRNYTCPTGYRIVVLTNAICQVPVLYQCKFYQCVGPSGRLIPATSAFSGLRARPNPDCAPDPLASPCSNDPGNPRSFAPSRQHLVAALPAIFPPAYLEPPLPPARP